MVRMDEKMPAATQQGCCIAVKVPASVEK